MLNSPRQRGVWCQSWKGLREILSSWRGETEVQYHTACLQQNARVLPPSARDLDRQQTSNENGRGSAGLALNVASETRRAIQPEHGLELKAEPRKQGRQSRGWTEQGAVKSPGHYLGTRRGTGPKKGKCRGYLMYTGCSGRAPGLSTIMYSHLILTPALCLRFLSYPSFIVDEIKTQRTK